MMPVATTIGWQQRWQQLNGPTLVVTKVLLSWFLLWLGSLFNKCWMSFSSHKIDNFVCPSMFDRRSAKHTWVEFITCHMQHRMASFFQWLKNGSPNSNVLSRACPNVKSIETQDTATLAATAIGMGLLLCETDKCKLHLGKCLFSSESSSFLLLRVLRSSPYQSLIRTKSCWVKR